MYYIDVGNDSFTVILLFSMFLNETLDKYVSYDIITQNQYIPEL